MRPREVFVRELSPEEGNRLKSISRRAKYQSKRQRAMIVLASATGMPAPQIAEVVRYDASHVRKVIHEFNERGSARSTPTTGAGALGRRRPPSAIGWSRSRAPAPTSRASRSPVGRLRSCVITWPTEEIAVSAETLRRILHEAGLSHQRTRSWKSSPDPDFAAKAERVLSLYREPPADGPVVCFDEMGPSGTPRSFQFRELEDQSRVEGHPGGRAPRHWRAAAPSMRC